jgi:RNA recognition motif-containing protein
MDGGTFPMTVLISDPSARKQRSDEANSTLFVGGLTSKTTEADLRKLFAKVSSQTVCHMP